MNVPGGRRRPTGGGVVFNVGARAFECQGCGNLIPVKSAVVRDPEAMTQMRESLVNRQRSAGRTQHNGMHAWRVCARGSKRCSAGWLRNR
jgi:hypothetical protein